MSDSTNNNIYEKLTPQRKQLVDTVLKNLEEGTGLWQKGWKMAGASVSALTGKQYRGVNNFFLTLISMSRGYKDNRWMTFNQMQDKDYHFKTDEEGNSVGKGSGVTVEFFELKDKKTKQTFTRATLAGMDDDEKEEYMRDNVYPLRRYYRVFNGDLIEGLPAKEKTEAVFTGVNERAEKLLDYWDHNEAKFVYGGDSAFYRVAEDVIHLPERESFVSLLEFYGTALHEMGHSTGSEKRLNRDINNLFGSQAYALEELIAEIASMFMEQDLDIAASDNHLKNNSAYIQNWYDEIKENPNALFMAIADAEKISKYVLSKEQQKEIEPYAITTDEDELGNTTYKVSMIAAHGQTALAINFAFSSREALMAEFEKMQQLPYWADKKFLEVGIDQLQEMSIARAEAEFANEEKSEVYIKPSEAVFMATPTARAVSMIGRGIETLTKMSDREVVEKAGKTKHGDKFSTLYGGGSLFNNEDKDERSLMSRLAMLVSGDKEQLLRIFRSSGQFRDEKPNSLYEDMAAKAMQFVSTIRDGVANLSSQSNKIQGTRVSIQKHN